MQLGAGNHKILPLPRSSSTFDPVTLERDPEKWTPVFGKDRAQLKSWSPVLIPSKPVRLQPLPQLTPAMTRTKDRRHEVGSRPLGRK
jgi:hypothetical protein